MDILFLCKFLPFQCKFVDILNSKLGDLYKPYSKRPNEMVDKAKMKFQSENQKAQKLTDYLK